MSSEKAVGINVNLNTDIARHPGGLHPVLQDVLYPDVLLCLKQKAVAVAPS